MAQSIFTPANIKTGDIQITDISTRSRDSTGKAVMITFPSNIDRSARDKIMKTFKEMVSEERKPGDPLFMVGFYENHMVIRAKVTSESKILAKEIEFPKSVDKKFNEIIEGLNKTVLEIINKAIVSSVIKIKIRAEATDPTTDPKDIFPLSESGYTNSFKGNGW